MNEKHKAFVYNLGQKVTLNPESKNPTLEHQQNVFFNTITKLAKTLSTTATENEQKSKGFWLRSNGKFTRGFSKQYSKEDQHESILNKEELRKQNQVAMSKDLASYAFNKTLLLDIALEKVKKKAECLMRESGKEILTDSERKEICTKTLEHVLYRLGGHFDQLKKSGVLNSVKGSFNESVELLLQKWHISEESELTPIVKEDHQIKAESSLVYLKYLKKRSLTSIDFLQLNDSEQKLLRRIMERKTDLAKFRAKSEKHEKCLERELQEELIDFNNYRREVLNVIGSHNDIDFPRKLIGGSKKNLDDEERSQETTNEVLISIWDRLNQRENVARKQWRHLTKTELAKPLDPNPGRIPCFSRAFKEYDKFMIKHKDMVKGDAQLKDQLTTNKERKDILRMHASKCYDSIIKSNNLELRQYGMISILKEMLELEFDLSKLPYPNHSIDQAGFLTLVQ